MFGDKTDSEAIAGYAKKNAKYKKQKAKYEKAELKYSQGRGHVLASYDVNPDVAMAKRSMELSREEMEKAKKARDMAARKMVADRIMDEKRNTIVLCNKRPDVRRERVYNPATGRNRYIEVNARSGLVTDRQLERSKRRVYGSNPPRGVDVGQPAMTTYRRHPNARQMVNWENHPDRCDVIGIDAPKGAIPSTGRYVGVPKITRDQFNKSYSPRPVQRRPVRRY